MKLLLFFILTLKLNKSNSVLYRAITEIKQSDLNHQCYKHLQTIKNEFDMKNKWALKMIDSSGSENSGFMLGNNFWFGSRDECDMIEKPDFLELDFMAYKNSQELIVGSKAPFPVGFRMVHADFNTSNQFSVHCFSEVCFCLVIGKKFNCVLFLVEAAYRIMCS